MTTQQDLVIDVNLRLIGQSKRMCCHKSRLISDKGRRLTFSESTTLIKIMTAKDLIETTEDGNGVKCCIKRFGLEVLEKGGWIKYSENQKEVEKSNLERLQIKEQLELENLKLQKENFEIQRKVELQESQIRKLDKQIKIIDLIKGYWWLLALLLGAGIYILSFL